MHYDNKIADKNIIKQNAQDQSTNCFFFRLSNRVFLL